VGKAQELGSKKKKSATVQDPTGLSDQLGVHHPLLIDVAFITSLEIV